MTKSKPARTAPATAISRSQARSTAVGCPPLPPRRAAGAEEGSPKAGERLVRTDSAAAGSYASASSVHTFSSAGSYGYPVQDPSRQCQVPASADGRELARQYRFTGGKRVETGPGEGMVFEHDRPVSSVRGLVLQDGRATAFGASCHQIE